MAAEVCNAQISVIIPIYNVESFVEECVDSILNQTYSNLELILVDDGSTDRSGEICDRYASRDSRVRVFHTVNQGVSAARNLGLEKACESSSEYFYLMDSDDWLDPNALKILVETAERENADIVQCAHCIEFLDKVINNNVENASYCGAEIIPAHCHGKIISSLWDKVWKKKLFQIVSRNGDGRVFTEGRIYEDITTTYQLLIPAEKVISIDQVFYHHRERASSIVHHISMKNLSDRLIAQIERYYFYTCVYAVQQSGTPYTEVDSSSLKGIYKRIDLPNPKLVELAASKVPLDEKLLQIELDTCVYSISKIWWNYWDCPKEERKAYHETMVDISEFSRTSFPFKGRSTWPSYQRVMMMLSRSVSAPIFIVANGIYKMYRKAKRYKEF